MLTFFWTVCSLEKVMVWPVWSVRTSVPSLTSTSRLSAICMTIPSHVVVSMRQSAAKMSTKFVHKMRSRTSQCVRGLTERVLCW